MNAAVHNYIPQIDAIRERGVTQAANTVQYIMAAALGAAAVVAAVSYVSYRAGRSGVPPRAARISCRTTPAMLERGSTYFLSGVMGGSGGGGASLAGVAVESQDYRACMRAAILAADSTAVVIDPAEIVEKRARELHPPGTPESQFFTSDETIRTMFGECVSLAAKSDVVISYLPVASMGSACELHEARAAGRLVLVIAEGKMSGNWVVRSYADQVLDDIPALGRWIDQHLGTIRTIPPMASAAESASAPETSLRGLNGSITFLYSHHFGTSRAFYEEDLGLFVRSDKGVVVFYALPSAESVTSGSSLGIVKAGVSAAVQPPCSAADAGRDTVMLCLLASDVDAAFERALAGGRCTAEQAPRYARQFGIYNALLRDPDGYLVELQCFLEPTEHRAFCGLP